MVNGCHIFHCLLSTTHKNITTDSDVSILLVTPFLIAECLKIRQWCGVMMLLRCSVWANKGIVEEGFCCDDIKSNLGSMIWSLQPLGFIFYRVMSSMRHWYLALAWDCLFTWWACSGGLWSRSARRSPLQERQTEWLRDDEHMRKNWSL